MFDDISALMQATDVAAAINNGLGINADAFQTNEVTLVAVMVDDSSSIRSAGNTDHVRDGYNGVLDALLGSKAGQANTIMWHGRMLNGAVITPFVLLKDAPRLDGANYNPAGNTPLYDRSVEFFSTVAAKIKEFQDAGVVVKAVALIITDGADVGSRRNTPGDVEKIVKSLLRSETAIVHAMGIDDGGTDFRRVFHAMGIPDDAVMLPGSTGKEIRAACQLFSQSAIRVSQTAGGLGALAT